MNIGYYIQKLTELNACCEAVEWSKQFDTSQEAWENCKRGDWMLWLVGKLSGGPGGDKRKKLVLAACQCARLSLKYVKEGEERPLKAIETAEGWAKGEAGITLDDVKNAAYAARTAAYAADAIDVAAYVVYVADAAADAAYADIVRKHYPDIDEVMGVTE
jgi:hypothetical protein